MENNNDSILYEFKSILDKLKCEDCSFRSRLELMETLKKRLQQAPVTGTEGNRIKQYYNQVIEFLLDKFDSNWCHQLRCEVNGKLYDEFFFIDGYFEESLLFLIKMVDECRLSEKLDMVLKLCGHFLITTSILGGIFLHQSVIQTTDRDLHSALWQHLVTGLVSLPDRVANKYQRQKAPNVFVPDVYFSHVTKALMWCLEGLHHQLINGIDSSTQLMSMMLGRSCLAGNSETIIPPFIDSLCQLTLNDFIWQRISQKLFLGLPDNTIESVLTCLFRKCRWSKALSRILGRQPLDRKRHHFIITNKLLLIRTFDDDRVLRNIIGYLADERDQNQNFVKVLLNVLNVWGNKSSLKHRPFIQHQYMTKAILISIGHLTDEAKLQYKQGILKMVMHGVESHLSNPILDVRRLGMFTAECIIKQVDPDGPQLSFEYERNEEIVELAKLLTPLEDPDLKDLPSEMSELSINQEVGKEVMENREPVPSVHKELDSDDDLEPYDLSNDTVFNKRPKPRYLRDCMAGLIDSSDVERTQMCLETAESLIRTESVGLTDVAVEMTKILLHLDDAGAMQNFSKLRIGALTAMAVQHPRQISAYLCEQFYDRNYNLRQRMDILEILVAASQELSQVGTSSATSCEHEELSEKFESSMPTTENWRQIVQKRIDAKTRIISKGRSKPQPTPKANKFATVAGCFFYPLVKHYDRKENTFDLLGTDFFVLGRLIYSLAMIHHATANSPVAAQMGKALLEFLWGLRYHTEAYVRQAIVFAICMTVMTVPSHVLVSDLQDGILDCQKWLNDVVTNESDAECQQLALKTLMVMESAIKEELHLNTLKNVQQ